jgi:hypothetical protein
LRFIFLIQSEPKQISPIPFTQMELENFPVASLADRYRIGKSRLYERLKQLGIQTHTVNGRAYITLEQVKLLDEFNQHIIIHGQGKTFIEALSDELQTSNIQESEIISITPDFIKILLILEEYEKRCWLITTQQLAQLLGKSPSRFHGIKTYNYRGFIFNRCQDSTRETTWYVTKLLNK